jgi:hypothetical protein
MKAIFSFMAAIGKTCIVILSFPAGTVSHGKTVLILQDFANIFVRADRALI